MPWRPLWGGVQDGVVGEKRLANIECFPGGAGRLAAVPLSYKVLPVDGLHAESNRTRRHTIQKEALTTMYGGSEPSGILTCAASNIRRADQRSVPPRLQRAAFWASSRWLPSSIPQSAHLCTRKVCRQFDYGAENLRLGHSERRGRHVLATLGGNGMKRGCPSRNLKQQLQGV